MTDGRPIARGSQRSILTKILGIGPEVEPDIVGVPCAEGDRLAARPQVAPRPLRTMAHGRGGGVTSYLEVWAERGRRLVPLDSDRVTIGRAESSDIALGDATVSRLHAVVERYPSGWSIRDVGSSNGTFVNGARVVGERLLQPGDEVSVGAARMFLRSPETEVVVATVGAEDPPVLTRKEREVLVALCRPLVEGRPFPAPPTVRELAAKFVVSEAAVKQHLSRLYEKFGIVVTGEARRVRLANEAVRRRAVNLSDLHSP